MELHQLRKVSYYSLITKPPIITV